LAEVEIPAPQALVCNEDALRTGILLPLETQETIPVSCFTMPPATLQIPPGSDSRTIPPVRTRILRQARGHFFAHGYSAFTMGDLALELGMSKKTLYVHFAGKNEIMRAIIEEIGTEIRAEADALLRNRRLNFAEKLRGFMEGMMRRMSAVHPVFVRDLQRFAPELHQLVVELRQQNIPYVFGRFIEEGQRSGLVRTDLNVGFAIEFYLQAVQGLFQPATLERMQCAPRDIIHHAITLFFGGLLTPAGHKEYEKLFHR
jgi:AcrR family transcriptional regulator